MRHVDLVLYPGELNAAEGRPGSGRNFDSDMYSSDVKWSPPLCTQVVTDSPWAFYRMAETTGTIMHDCSGNGHDGSYSNMALNGASPFSVEAASYPPVFDGSVGSYASIGGSSGIPASTSGGIPFATAFTVELFLYKSAINDNTQARILDCNTAREITRGP